MLSEEKLETAGRTYKRHLTVNVFDAARQRMEYIYQNFDTVVISWSSGKDSSSCLELARETAKVMGKLPIHVYFLDEEVIYPESLDLCYRHKADPEIIFHWVCIPSIYRNACSEEEPDFIPWEPGKEHLWTHQAPDDALWPCGHALTTWRVPPSIVKLGIYDQFGNHPEIYGRVCMVTGLRTRESFVRYSGIMSSASFLTKKEHGCVHGRPIYDWTAKDVWLAIKDFGWDYNKAYDKLWRAGGSVENTRVAPLFHAEAAHMLKRVMHYWPEWWGKVRLRVKGVHSMGIYEGQLHHWRCLPGETWQQAAERYWHLLGSEESRMVLRNAIERRLKKHAEHSNQPLPETGKCPKCGLCWKTIAKACCLDDRQLRILEPYNT